MKRLVILFFAILLLISCGSSNVIQTSKKTLKGYWTLNNISYSEAGEYNVTLFNDVSSECLAGSTWRFIPNNNSGNYDVTSSDCTTGKRYFIWSIPNNNGSDTNYDILLKPTNEKLKSATNQGFRLQLSYLSDTDLQINQTVQVDGSPFTISMNFTKTSE